MKYDDLDAYIDNLFNNPDSQPDSSDNLSGFDDRLANVERAILDAYESAMRWHSAQIAGESTTETMKFGAYSGPDSGVDNNYGYSPMTGSLDSHLIVRGRKSKRVTVEMATVVMQYENAHKPITPIEIFFYILVAGIVLAIGLPACQIITRLLYGARW